MTLEQLRIFVAVAEREHVTQAGHVLNRTQSATSTAVAALEARYGVKFFNRVGRRIELTYAGRLFVHEAKAVLARAADAESVLADLAGLARGSLAIAASQTVGNYWLPPVIERYRAAYPGVSVSLAIANTEVVSSMVREGAANLGFVEGAVDDPALSIAPVARDTLALVASPSFARYEDRCLTADDLTKMRWVVRERGSGTRTIFDKFIAGMGLSRAQIDVALELPSNEAVRTAIEHGEAATILSMLVVDGLLQAGRLVRLQAAVPTRCFLTLRHKERFITNAERAFGDLLRSSPPIG